MDCTSYANQKVALLWVKSPFVKLNVHMVYGLIKIWKIPLLSSTYFDTCQKKFIDCLWYDDNFIESIFANSEPTIWP